jgi:hypothetical protein
LVFGGLATLLATFFAPLDGVAATDFGGILTLVDYLVRLLLNNLFNFV